MSLYVSPFSTPSLHALPPITSCHSLHSLKHSMSLHHSLSVPAVLYATLHTLHQSTTSLPVSLCHSLQHSLSLSVSSCITHCYYLSLPSSLCHSQHSLHHSLSLSVTFCPSLQSLPAADVLPSVLPGFLLVRANL